MHVRSVTALVLKRALGRSGAGHARIVSVSSDADLDQFLGALDYPMYVVTTRSDDDLAGCLVGFTTQTSIDPVRFLVCISDANATARAVASASHVAVHVLGRDNLDLARLFGEESEDWTDKFDRCAWREGPRGMPVLDASPAWFVGEIVDRRDVGDHTGLLLAPVATGGSPTGDLLTFQQLKDLDPGHPA
jgi:flavin reductase (DIM6/NTAB) family NADH-FMN oxidoreductase RutF